MKDVNDMLVELYRLPRSGPMLNKAMATVEVGHGNALGVCEHVFETASSFAASLES